MDYSACYLYIIKDVMIYNRADMKALVTSTTNTLQLGKMKLVLPTLIIDAGKPTAKRFVEFFTANIRNPNTREAYGRAVRDFFAWCDEHQIGPLIDIEALHVAAYIEQLTQEKSAQTVKQRLAAIKALFDLPSYGRHLMPANPASVRCAAPSIPPKKGKTPILLADDARALIKSIDTSTLSGLRDRAIIATMTYSFARVSAAHSHGCQRRVPHASSAYGYD